MASQKSTHSNSGIVGHKKAAPLIFTELEVGEDIDIGRATLMLADGQPPPSGLDLVIATVDGSGGATKQKNVIVGDGTDKVDITGESVASYINSSGGSEYVGVFVDNGHFNSGTGTNHHVVANIDIEDIDQPPILRFEGESDWGNPASSSNMTVADGGAILSPTEETWENDATGTLPSNWTDGSEGNNRIVDTQAHNGSQSFKSDLTNGSDGAVLAYTTLYPSQYTQTFVFYYYETSNNTKTAMSFKTSSGDNLLWVGTNNPQVAIDDGDGYTELIDPSSPAYGVWRKFEVTFDWGNRQHDVVWRDIGGNEPDQTASGRSLLSATTDDIETIEITNGGDAGGWGGVDVECWVDDITSNHASSGTLTTQTKSMPESSRPDLQNLSYSLNGQSTDLVIIGSPGTASSEEQSVTLDGSPSFSLNWSNPHSDFRVRLESSSSGENDTPKINTVELQ